MNDTDTLQPLNIDGIRIEQRHRSGARKSAIEIAAELRARRADRARATAQAEDEARFKVGSGTPRHPNAPDLEANMRKAEAAATRANLTGQAAADFKAWLSGSPETSTLSERELRMCAELKLDPAVYAAGKAAKNHAPKGAR